MKNQVKIYEMPGCISCRLKFSLGRALPFEAFFDGGIPDKNYPAVYVASTIGQQLAIENSDMFKAGKIRLRKGQKPSIIEVRPRPTEVGKGATKTIVEPVEKDVEVVEPQPEPTDNAFKEYPEVTTLVDAIAILKGEYGVSATRLRSDAGVARVAEEKGVSFPNLKL